MENRPNNYFSEILHAYQQTQVPATQRHMMQCYEVTGEC